MTGRETENKFVFFSADVAEEVCMLKSKQEASSELPVLFIVWALAAACARFGKK